MNIHILGICGTFMGNLAILARQCGHNVEGTDENAYPPMSNTLRAAGIAVYEGYSPTHLNPRIDIVIVGNTISRTNPMIDAILNRNIPYTSGPQWLAENVLRGKHVLAVSGTHGKTTTTSLLAWILKYSGLNPGYLIGGVANNFSEPADLGGGKFFVIEADEYDSAFFDKRSKFIHYRPRTLVINNLEFDHADIFASLEQIKEQFQYLLRTVPASGLVVYKHQDPEIEDVIARGCWASSSTFGNNGIWHAENINADGSEFELWHRDQKLGVIEWGMCGQHNVLNALAALAAAHNAGITGQQAIAGLKNFKGIKRRLEIRGVVNNITIYDDFAHHPTAIEMTLAGLRARVGNQRIIAVLEFASNTMRMGVHTELLSQSLTEADKVLMLKPHNAEWDVNRIVRELGKRAKVYSDVSEILQDLLPQLQSEDHVLIMSNRGFDGIHQRLIHKLESLPVGQ